MNILRVSALAAAVLIGAVWARPGPLEVPGLAAQAETRPQALDLRELAHRLESLEKRMRQLERRVDEYGLPGRLMPPSQPPAPRRRPGTPPDGGHREFGQTEYWIVPLNAGADCGRPLNGAALLSDPYASS